MRSIITMLVCLCATALAKPKVAVAPLAGDLPSGKLTIAVADALGDDYAVISGKALGKVTKKTGELDDDVVAKIHKQLAADAVVHGSVVKEGKKRSLQLKVSVKGQDTRDLTVKLKGATLDDDGRTRIRDAVAKGLVAAEEADKPRPLSRRHEEPEQKEKEKEKDKPVEKKRRVAEPEAPVKVKKRKKRRDGGDDDDDAPAVKRATQDLFVDAGGAFGMRRLTYDSTATRPPPTVATGAASGRVAGELYAKAAGATGALANLGIAGAYDKAFGLSIPLGMAKVPIDQGHYAVGLRYRIPAGAASVLVLGVDYAARHYIADRSGLTATTPLDAPDTDYEAVQVDAGGRTPLTGSVTGFALLSGTFPFAAGPIQKIDSYGPANLYGLGLTAGVDIAVATQIAVRIAGEVEQMSLSFKGTGNLAQTRMVTAATDRELGISATLALVY